MAYSERIKDFERIREYMRQFYVYGFRSRMEYDKKSARSYDNERRRMESWLGDFMRFRQTGDGKNVFLCVDTRAIAGNPLYNAFKAKSFTAGDVTFHFYILDILRDGQRYTAGELLDRISDRYLCHFESDWQPDLSTVRKKLKEYVSLGLLEIRKEGREVYFSLAADSVPLDAWADTVAFFSEADPLGVIGSTVLDKLALRPDYYQFKHHYMLHALDSQVLLSLLMAIGDRMAVDLTNTGIRGGKITQHTVCPLKIYVSTQGGRQYLLCYHYRFKRLIFFRLDHIRKAVPTVEEKRYEKYLSYLPPFQKHLWGTSFGEEPELDHLEMILRFEDDELYILQRLEREKRNGRVERIGQNTCKYIVDTYDASELLPWLRTFIGRVEQLECSDPEVTARFYRDLEALLAMYGGRE